MTSARHKIGKGAAGIQTRSASLRASALEARVTALEAEDDRPRATYDGTYAVRPRSRGTVPGHTTVHHQGRELPFDEARRFLLDALENLP